MASQNTSVYRVLTWSYQQRRILGLTISRYYNGVVWTWTAVTRFCFSRCSAADISWQQLSLGDFTCEPSSGLTASAASWNFYIHQINGDRKEHETFLCQANTVSRISFYHFINLHLQYSDILFNISRVSDLLKPTPIQVSWEKSRWGDNLISMDYHHDHILVQVLSTSQYF